MKPRDLAELQNEPACEHNHTKPKGGCPRPTPGAAAGGCTFDGAQIALLPIADVAHVVHGPAACAGNSWESRGSRSSGPSLYRIGMTTDLTEQDVIMGRGEERLFHGIRQAVERYRPAAVFVYATCVTALIGDDMEAACRAAAESLGLPVVPVDGAGFYGSKNLGNRIAGEAMVRHVVGGRDPEPVPAAARRRGVRVHDVCLVGEYNIAGELWQVLPLLDELGLRLLCSLSGDARFRQVQTMHRSRANMLVCSQAMLNVVRGLEERYGTPWFEGSFYGIRDTSEALRSFARLLGDDDLSRRTEALIAREEAAIRETLRPWRERLQGRRAVLYTGGVKSWSVVSALQDLGVEVLATGTRKSTESDKDRVRELMGEDADMLDAGGPRQLLDTVAAHRADLLIAGGRNMYTALKARIPFLDINQEREYGYAGYAGMVNLARELVRTLDCPVWAQVRQPAPWRRKEAVHG